MQYKDEGNRFYKAGQWKEAVEQYTKGLQDNSAELPGDVRGLLLSNRCQCRLNLEEWQGALEDANAALLLLPEHAKSLFRRASAYERLGKPDLALSDYIKVVKAEPQNRASVEAAQRLREEVLKTGQRKRDEVLPAHLLDTLRGNGTVDEKVDACAKLKALCVHKSLTGALMSAGALELLLERATAVTAATPAEEADELKDLRSAALTVLVAMASGCALEDEDDKACRSPPKADGPLPVPADAAEVRKRLRSLLRLADLRRACKGHAASARHLAVLVGFTHEPEDPEALEAVHDALCFPEEGEVNPPRGGVMALAMMCDTRRRLGKMGKPLVPTGTLLKCVESALGTTTCAEPLRSLTATVFALFADKDRPKGQEVDLAAVGLRILEPFLQSEDPALRCNGLSGLSSLLASDVQTATQLLQQSNVPFLAILNSLQKPPPGVEGRTAQSHAIECMLLAAGDRKTRQAFIDGGGIDMLIGSLGDGEEGSGGLIRAKLVAVLAVIAGHNKDVREEVFDRMDFLMELRHALETARESVSSAHAGGSGAPTVEEARRLCRGLYESCACLTIHGEFKESLIASKKTLKAMQELVTPADLAEDMQLGFLYASLMYNLCRSREDKVRPKKNEFPFNELDEDDLNALEEFYEKMPAESRPVKNGEVDAGSKELAEKIRIWCVLQGASSDSAKCAQSGTTSHVVALLAKCATNGSARVKGLVAYVLRFLCMEQKHRKFVVSNGGIRALLGIVDVEDEMARDAARQTLAQICINTNPSVLSYSEQLDLVRPLVQTLEHRHELLQFEAAMGLTNLLIVSEELRTRALQADAWRVLRDLLFSENEQLQRAGLEAMCNLTMAEEILERFADGKADIDIKVFCAFCRSEDRGIQVAASGALAMLCQYPEVAEKIASHESFPNLGEALAEAADPGVQHRLVAALCHICEAEGSPPEATARARAALRAKRACGNGFASREAEQLAQAALEEVGGG